MRDYLPLVFEVLLAVVVIGWGVRELILLKRDESSSEPGDAGSRRDTSDRK
jgi:hypothetical protein